MNTHKNPPFIFAIDPNFLEPLRNALRSLVKVTEQSDRLEIFVLHHGNVSQSSINQLHIIFEERPTINIQALAVDRFVADEAAEVNKPAYLRLAIPQMFASYERVIYLDADIVFVQNPLELLDLKLDNDCVIAASQDVQNPLLGSGIALPGWERLGFDPTQRYFNSGVMIIATERWNAQQITRKAIEFVSNHPEHIRFNDQDALNYILHDLWQTLPMKFNYPPLSAILKVKGARYYAEAVFPLQTMIEGEHSAIILHFVGPDKPWKGTFPESDVTTLYRELIA